MVLFGFGKKLKIPSAKEALPGRAESMPVTSRNYVNGNPLKPPYPDGLEIAMFGMGCFWEQNANFGSKTEFSLL